MKIESNFIKFLIIGFISTIINYIVFLILYKTGVYYIISSTLGYVSGLILGYHLNNNLNFNTKNKNNYKFIKYISIYIINLIISIKILYILVEYAGINPYISNFLILIYTTIGNYLGLKYYVFKRKKILSISISGDSGSGKSKLTNILSEILGEKNISLLNGDSSHKWERNDKNWNKITHLNPNGNFLEKEEIDIKKLLNGSRVIRKNYDHAKGIFTENKIIKPKKIIIYEGLHGLYGDIGKLFDFRIFVESENNIKNKITRDTKERNRNIDKLIKNIEKRKYDYNKYILPQKENANLVIYFSDNHIKVRILKGITKELYNIIKDIKGIIIDKNDIIIDNNILYKINPDFLKKNKINFLTDNSSIGVLKIILILLIKNDANNNTNGLNLKKIQR